MTKSTITREESIQAVFDLKVGYTLGLADIETLKRVARMALAAMDSEPVVPKNCVTAEHRRVVEMLLNVCGSAFELADDSCQQDVDGEDCHVVPDDAFQKLSDALDEIENTLPTEDIDRPDVFLAWSAMPRAALKSLLQAQPAPELKPVGYLFASDQGAITYSPTDWGMPGFRLAGQIFGDIDVELKPAPVVPEDVRQALRKMDDEIIAELDAEESACRAAMLTGGKS